jgi:kumamolisin
MGWNKMRKSLGLKTRLAAAAAGAALAGLSSPVAAAQDRPVTLSSSVAPFGSGVKVLGEAPGQADVSFEVVLKLRDYDALERSNLAGRVMGYAEMKARHLPTAQAYDRVLNFLVDKGIHIDSKADDRMTIEASAPAAVVSRALGVHFSRVLSEGREYVAADTAPVVPASLAPVLLGVNGLQPYLHAVKLSRIGRYDETRPPYYSQAFVSGYGATGLGNAGQNTTTAIIIDVFPLQTDVTAYWTLTGVSQTWDNITLIQTYPNAIMGPPTGEESLDTEIASSVADNSHVRVYASTDLTFSHINLSLRKLIADMTKRDIPVQQVSISLGACEKAIPKDLVKTDNHFFAVLSGLGASIFVSTGDDGSDTCQDGTATPSFFSTSPNVTAVGGTSLLLTKKGRVKSEAAWSGSGGGVSVYFRSPAYQSDLGLGFKKRTVPDISTDGDPDTGALVILAGAPLQVGGTSLSAPIMAALTARVNSSRLQAGKTPLGLLNGRLYPMIGGAGVRDVVEGSNGAYAAGEGYDMVTGIGAPVMDHMLPELVDQP